MNLYVYRINEREYGAGTGLAECEKLGSVVERWPLKSRDDAKFLATHGTSYHGASEQVSRIADLVYELMTIDPTFQPPTPAPAKAVEVVPEPKRPGFIQRIKTWCFAH